MQRVILVVSPDTEFLQQLRSHLEEGGRYQVTVALSAHEALNLANSNFFEIAIVDGELDDIPVAAFTRDLSALQSELKILVFPPDNNPQHPVLEGLVANGFLTKPFSGQEIGKALTSLFSDQPMASIVQVKVVDDLVKQWLQIPETGGRKAEQILESTTAQTVLIIIKDQLIASAGSIDEGMVNNVTGFLSRYWKEEENSELARFLKLDGDGSERFLYATKLVSNVVLVLVYPMNATLQLVRRELNNVKDDFQQHYPTTSELRQDIAKQTLAEINARNKKLESLQPNSTTISQTELDLLKVLQQETQKTSTSAVSQAELDLLKAMQAEPPPPAVDAVTLAELEARKLFEQESNKPKPTLKPISQEEIDMLKALEDETSQPTVDAISQVELDARKLFEQESLKSKPPMTSGISQDDINALIKMQQEASQPAADAVSQAELDALKLFEQESLKPNLAPTSGMTQDDINALINSQQTASQPTAEVVSQAELDARKLFEQESLKTNPPTTSGMTQDDINALINSQKTASQPATDAISQTELDARRLFEQESLKQKPSATTTGISQDEIDSLKALQQNPPQTAAAGVAQYELDALQLFHQESLKPTTVPPSAISEQELAELSKLLEQMPAPDPQSETETPVEEKKLPEWLNELESIETSVQSLETSVPQSLPIAESAPTGIPPFVGIDERLKQAPDLGTTVEPVNMAGATVIAAASEPLPEIDFKLPWEMEETTAEAVSEIQQTLSVEPVAESVLEPVADLPIPPLQPIEPVPTSAPEPIVEPPLPSIQPVEPAPASTIEPAAKQPIPPVTPNVEAPIEALQPATSSFAEVLSAVTPLADNIPDPSPAPAVVEPVAPPALPNLKDFRFNYTCVLLPGDREQFLARDLSEKLSSTMPDIHEDQGWRMTSITIRPQYLLWTVAVPMGTCPNQIMHEVRNLTSNLIFAKFPEIAKKKTSNDFWSSKYLAVSGSEPPPANLIFEFVTNAWKKPETETP